VLAFAFDVAIEIISDLTNNAVDLFHFEDLCLVKQSLVLGEDRLHSSFKYVGFFVGVVLTCWRRNLFNDSLFLLLLLFFYFGLDSADD